MNVPPQADPQGLPAESHPRTERRSSRFRSSIALKIATFSWMISTGTLLLFVLIIVPEQKRVLEESLTSKARGLSASLQDVIAGAAITEDYSSVVDQCRQVLEGDETIAYIVITKNDGLSLIHEAAGKADPSTPPGLRPEPQWHQQQLGAFWHPQVRKPSGGIGLVPLLGRRLFHYSRPFDYSGIEWGWINLGLSVEAYDKSVSTTYYRTGWLALACAAFSLMLSLLYARRLVRPIHALQEVLRSVSAGDLSARAAIRTRDEVEGLANAFNRMTENLLQRDRILEGVRHVGQVFLFSSDWHLVVEEVLAIVGESAQVSRVDLFRVQEDPAGRVLSHRYSWASAPDPALGGMALLENQPWCQAWQGVSEEPGPDLGMAFGLLRHQNPEFRQWLEPLGVRSLVLVPVKVGGALWGFLCMSDCLYDRLWTESEKDSFRAVADMLGATVASHQAQAGLRDAKAYLEQRVLDRTRELQEEVAEKEKAHADLSEAQHSLMDLSRQAGMAEVATGVLHNVGNVLNSVNVSASLIREQLRCSEVSTLVDLSHLLQQHEAELPAYLTVNPVGMEIPRFIIQLADQIEAEHTVLRQEQDHLARNIEHIKEIVSMQQSYARVSGVLELVSAVGIMEDALRIHESVLSHREIQVIRDYAELPPLLLDHHKILQILVNLIQNASHALVDSGREGRLLSVRVALRPGDRLELTVTDNGIGIPPENLTRIFSHGFSTRAEGHGFALHSGALAAKEMGGELRAFSEGPGTGATFTLEIPMDGQNPKSRSEA